MFHTPTPAPFDLRLLFRVRDHLTSAPAEKSHHRALSQKSLPPPSIFQTIHKIVRTVGTAILMVFSTSQNLFKLNQELLTLAATHPSTHAAVDCFNFTKPSGRSGRSVGRSFSSPAQAVRTDDRFSVSASVAHFSVLVEALAAAFPDFDFSSTCPWNFKLIGAPEQAQANINWAFQTRLTDAEHILPRLWLTLEKEVSPGTCSIYAYDPDRPDAFSESGAVFNLCYFFLNEKSGKVVLLNLREGGRDLDFSDDAENEVVEDVEERYGYGVW